jgi:sterol 3beta-glucosyltransferase
MPVKITILTYGSRGDVQPFLPLSLGLMQKGHCVKLAAPSRFENLVKEHGIDFVPLAGEPEELSRRLNDAGHNFIKMIRELMDHAIEIGADVFHQTQEACKGADLIIHSFTHVVGAHTLAREMKIPDIHVQPFPMFSPTGDYPNVTLPDFKLRPLNRLTHSLSQTITWWSSKVGFEQVSRRAGLSKRKLYWPFEEDPFRPRTPILCAWSPSVIPPSADWPPRVHVTGYYFFPLTGDYEPPDEMDSFLRAGPPPICVTFGSMVHRDQERIHRIIVDALKRTKNRGVILSGWGGVTSHSSENILYLEAAPHDWLLPRCKMVIHHGGAGTSSAGLRAGIPNIIVPFTADQPFWGRRVQAIGAGPKPILVRSLSVGKLAYAIAKSESQALRERAQAIGARIRGEDGVGQALQLIEDYSNNFHKHCL